MVALAFEVAQTHSLVGGVPAAQTLLAGDWRAAALPLKTGRCALSQHFFPGALLTGSWRVSPNLCAGLQASTGSMLGQSFLTPASASGGSSLLWIIICDIWKQWQRHFVSFSCFFSPLHRATSYPNPFAVLWANLAMSSSFLFYLNVNFFMARHSLRTCHIPWNLLGIL